MNQYHLVIVGGGPAGYVAAIRASQFGMKVALVERSKLGGTCLNRGCIPTKALLHSANAYAECSKFEEIGLFAQGLSYDMEKIHGRKDHVVETLRGGVEQLLKSNGVNVIVENAVISEANVVTVDGTTYTADKILVAAESSPSKPPIPGLNLEGVVTSNVILEGPVKDYKSLVIIGGGVIGIEMASVYSALGCQVTIVEALDRILANMDKEFSQKLSMLMKKRGVQIFCSSMVEKIEQADDGLKCCFTQKNQAQSVKAEGVLVSIGRRPNTEGLFAEGIALEMNRGFIVVNEKYESSIPGIYAIGDVIGGIQLAHKAEAEGIAVVELMNGNKPSVDPKLVPSCIYTNPEIASVGISADDAKKEGRSVKTGKYLMTGNGKSIIELQDSGFVKAVFDSETDVLLGIQMMCGRASDLISEFTGMILNGTTLEQLLKGMRPHPSFCEGISEAVEAVEGKSIHSASVRG
ncbi:Dihydrolipoyl dehydrogenase [anaerobic digester metagenome]